MYVCMYIYIYIYMWIDSEYHLAIEISNGKGPI